MNTITFIEGGADWQGAVGALGIIVMYDQALNRWTVAIPGVGKGEGSCPYIAGNNLLKQLQILALNR